MSEPDSDQLGPDERFFIAMYEALRRNGVAAFKGDPERILKALKAQSPGIAKSGLRTAVADLLEMTDDLQGEQLVAVDGFLTQRGAPTLTAQRLTRKRWITELLNRGRIANDDECRALMARLNDVEDKVLTPSQRSYANAMLASYEQKAP